MNRMLTRSTHLVVAVGIMLLGLFANSPGASADTTPETCDTSGPKYWCVHIDYDPGPATVYNRWYTGAIDGGAKSWQRYWATDYHWDGSTWATVRSWGAGNWYSDSCLCGHWEALSGGDIAQAAIVMVRLRYHEYTPETGWYYWCSNQNEHHLYDNTSLVWGTGQC